MRNEPSRFREVQRILRENEQLHRGAGYLEARNHQLLEELRIASLQLEWISTIAGERPRPISP